MPLFDLPLNELERYVPDVPEPPDFDDFWRGSLSTGGGALLDVHAVSNDLRVFDTREEAQTWLAGTTRGA